MDVFITPEKSRQNEIPKMFVPIKLLVTINFVKYRDAEYFKNRLIKKILKKILLRLKPVISKKV